MLCGVNNSTSPEARHQNEEEKTEATMPINNQPTISTTKTYRKTYLTRTINPQYQPTINIQPTISTNNQ